MRKKILSGIAFLTIVIIAVIVTLNLGISSNREVLSGLFLANIEALSNGEGCDDCSVYELCDHYCMTSNQGCRITNYTQGWQIDCKYKYPGPVIVP